ncbi:hypothetical protein B0H16DRAFT_1809600, partial [Mycena metata]
MSDKVMWAGVHRTGRNIFEACDTNMLVEAWHHVLKGKFLHGKRNRRLDHLISTLVTEVLPYYALKQRRQAIGFEGPDIEVRKRQDIIQRSNTYQESDIEDLGDGNYRVRSQSDPSKFYDVDIETYSCTCLDFPLICFCKHICAVQRLFKEPGSPSIRPDLPAPSFSSIQQQTGPVDSHAQEEASNVALPKIGAFVFVAEKLERLAARLRKLNKKDRELQALPELVDAVDAMLIETDDGQVLPVSQKLPSNDKSSWKRTRAAMMPGVKMKRAPAGDPAYGAGASSGGLAKKAEKKKARTKYTSRRSK